MAPSARSPRSEHGFTLIEVLVAALVLILGVTAAFQLVDGANATTTINGARTTATNLTRELTEFARGADYDSLQPVTVVTALRQNESVTGSGPSPWQIQRRGVTYTVAASVCTFDDPKDGTAPTSPPDNACPAGAAAPGVTKIDVNPDDFRRVTFTLSWRVRARTGTMTQSVLVVNPAGGLGPRITAFDPPAEVGPGRTSVTLPVTTSSAPAASGIHWSANDGVSQGDATGAGQNWSFTWNLGTPKLTPLTIDGTWVVDGDYLLSAQASDARGIPGESRVVTVHVNRHAPAAVTGVEAGYNPRQGGAVVDLSWILNGERDIRGYQVYRNGTTRVCPSDGSDYTTARTCTDTNPGTSGSVSYTVYAVDCESLAADTCVARRGDPSAPKIVNLSAGQPPDAPGGVTATIVDGLPKLDWTGVGGAKFYRIYRDGGTGLNGRYDTTITSSPTYTDPNPGRSTVHTYWVTTVDSSYNESQPSPPVTSPAG